MKYRLVSGLLILAASLSFNVSHAQTPPEPLPGQQFPPQPMPPPQKVLENFFRFDEAQMVAFRDLLEQRHQATRPLAGKLGDLERDWRELFAAPDPDPGAAGTLAVQMHLLRQQIQDIQKQFIQDFENLLRPDQKERLQLLRRSVRLEPIVNSLRPLNIF